MPGQNITITDFQVGNTAAVSDVIQIFGPSSSGTANELTRVSKVNDVNAQFGFGQMPLLAQRVIAQSGKAVDLIKTNVSTASTGSAVTQTGGGAALFLGPLAAYDRYQIRVEITTTGAPGTGFYKVSFDGGETFTAPVVIPTTFSKTYADFNVQLVFANSSYTAGTVYTATTTPPQSSASDFHSAFVAAQAENLQPPFVVLAQDITTGSQGVALGSQVTATELPAYKAVFQYPLALVNAQTGSILEIVPAWSAVEDKNLAVTVGTVRMAHPRPQPGYSLPLVPYLWAVAAKAASVRPWTGFDAVHVGSDPGVSSPSIDDFKLGGNAGAWLPHKFIAPRTFPGSNAVYPMSSRMKAPDGSDYEFFEWARVTSLGTAAVEQFQQRYVNSSQRVKTDGSGQIEEKAAAAIEGAGIRVFSALFNDPVDERGIKGMVSGFTYVVDRTNNVQLTKELNTTLRIVTLGKVITINTTIGLAASLG